MHMHDFSEDELPGLIRSHLPRAEGTEVPSGGDCAVIDLAADSVAVSTGMLVEGVHHRPEWLTEYDIERRAAMQNATDAAAMGTHPVSFVVALGIPGDHGVEWFVEFACGVGEVAKCFGASVDGGNLTRGPAAVGVTVVGNLSGRPPVPRSGARPGDRLIHCGILGRSAIGLHFLISGVVASRCVSVLSADGERSPALNGRAPDGPDAVAVVYKRPNPPVDLALAVYAVGRIRVLMDVSGGLIRDARHMAEASNVGVDINPVALKCNVDGFVCAGVRHEPAKGMVLGEGEDHGFLVVAPNSVPEGWRQIGSVRGFDLGDERGSGGFMTCGGRNVPKGTGWDYFYAERV